ncbi:MAG: hypothetical protein AAB432_00845 [Patescibacteria group bacterium]
MAVNSYKSADFEVLLKKATEAVNQYLKWSADQGQISIELFKKTKEFFAPRLAAWLKDPEIDRLSPNAKAGIFEAVRIERWQDLIEAFVGDITFGTSGIRGLMVLTDGELLQLQNKGLDAPILKGPNTVNNLVIARFAAGISKYLKEKKLKNVAIGFDSRIQSNGFAEIFAKIFLASGLRVKFFQLPVAYPELLFSVTEFSADLGLYVTASHNNRRYNGFKICGASGAALNIAERNDLYENFLMKAVFTDVPDFEKVPDLSKSVNCEFLGKEAHRAFLEHVQGFFLDKKVLLTAGRNLTIGYSAFHGAGINSVPLILEESGFQNVQIIKVLSDLNGFFPAFANHPEQQPDPGDRKAAELALLSYEKEYKNDFRKKNLDIIIGTDPDADRASVIAKTPAGSAEDYALLSADEAWLLVLWYRLNRLKESDDKFIVYSHVTTDALGRLAKKHNVGFLKTVVGFAYIAEAVKNVWEGKILSREKNPELVFDSYEMTKTRQINIGAFEQSYGFGFFGGAPKSPRELGVGGHVKDKDGVLGALMLAEIAAYAKNEGKTLLDLVHEIYLDPKIGFFVNYYEAEPAYGVYVGLEGFSKKINILKKAVALAEKIGKKEKVMIGGLEVKKAEIYRTGRYDILNEWKGFPDEGIRFYFDDGLSWLIIRPSGTTPALRFHIQLNFEVNRENIVFKRKQGYELAKKMITDFKGLISIF